VSAYFRAAGEAADASSDTACPPEGVPESLETIMELLTEPGVMPERPRARLEAADGGPQATRLTRVRRLLAYVHDRHETAYFTRTRELAFLANTLLAGCSVQSRPFTPQEASDAAASVCNLGLDYWPGHWSTTSRDASSPGPRDPAAAADTWPPDSFLVDHDLVTAFEVGWSVLHREVSLFVADQLIATLTDVDCVDREIRHGLVALRRVLVKHRDAGTPWLARGAADVLAMLDPTAWISVLGLLDECPIVPAAMIAILEGRTTTVSPTAFEFISTAARIADVRTFMRRLPEVLSR
jgi:hypothetical protein